MQSVCHLLAKLVEFVTPAERSRTIDQKFFAELGLAANDGNNEPISGSFGTLRATDGCSIQEAEYAKHPAIN